MRIRILVRVANLQYVTTDGLNSKKGPRQALEKIQMLPEGISYNY